MNKYQKALENVIIKNGSIKSCKIIKELVERATPKKLYNPYGDEALCPSCDAEQEIYYSLILKKYVSNNKFCPNCGQALDWGE